MTNKQNLWFMTLFSLILILGVYYITLPNDLLQKATNQVKKVTTVVKEENPLIAMRVSLEEKRTEQITNLKTQLTSNNLTTSEKNNVYEQLKYLNELQGKEESLEKKIKNYLNLDCFIKIDDNIISTTCISNEHNKSLANKIMRSLQEEYKNKMNINVKFQKKS